MNEVTITIATYAGETLCRLDGNLDGNDVRASLVSYYPQLGAGSSTFSETISTNPTTGVTSKEIFFTEAAGTKGFSL